MSATPLNSFRQIQPQWEDLLARSPLNTLFLTPQWQEIWWEAFGNGNKQMAGFYLNSPEGIVGIASLSRCGNTLSLMGNQETFDYNDFMVCPGYETSFYSSLLCRLEREGVQTLKLFSLLENSPTLSHLPQLASQRGYSVEVKEEDVAPGVTLPGTWDEYLSTRLSRKDRHELRRKFRRLEGEANHRCYSLSDPDAVAERLSDFFSLMRMSRPEKEQYMTPEREKFFRHMARRTAELDLLRLFFLELEGRPVATALCFDYGSARLLYNSGYDLEYSYYSVGLLLNALCLQDAIQQGKEYFDFLRGPEPYKYHLGGKDRTLYQMVVKRN